MAEGVSQLERANASGLHSAIALLTRFPTGGRKLGEGQALLWFPSVGALVGLICAGVGWSATQLLPALVTGAVCTLTLAWITGGLHLDGVADTTDGFSAAHAGPDRGLAAMRDSYIGAHGTVAIVLLLLTKFALLCSLVTQPTWEVWLPACLCSGAYSRFWVAQRLTTLPSARPTGMAASVATSGRTAAPWFGLALGLAVTLPLAVSARSLTLGLWPRAGVGPSPLPTDALPWLIALIAFALSGLAVFVLTSRARRAFGGLTGDVCGAGIELGEVCALLPWCAYATWLSGRLDA